MEFLTALLYFLIAIGILVFVHEFGHFFIARISGMRTEVFAIGMGPRVLGWNKTNGFSFGKLPKDFDAQGHTDYRIAALPVGGYVKIIGMIDESMDTDYIESEPQPWEFRSKNAFAKIMTLMGGVLMNVVFAFFAFAFIIGVQGKDFWATSTIGTVEKSSLAEKIGFKPNDKILSIDGKKIKSWDDLLVTLSLDNLGGRKQVELLRDNKNITLTADGKKIVQNMAAKKILGIFPKQVRVLLTAVQTLKPAGKVGLVKYDTILSVNNQLINTTSQFQKVIKEHSSIPIFLKWKHAEKVMSDSITPTSEGIIGVGIAQVYNGPVIHKNYSVFESIAMGWSETINTLNLIIGSFGQMINGTVSVKQSLGGPIAIAKMTTEAADRGFISFINFLALLSIMLAIINIFPFPGLDGGHIFVILIETIIRRELPVKAKVVIQQVGMTVLILFMIFVIYLDLTR